MRKREITYRFCQGRFIIWGSRDPCELATELALAGVEGGQPMVTHSISE